MATCFPCPNERCKTKGKKWLADPKNNSEINPDGRYFFCDKSRGFKNLETHIYRYIGEETANALTTNKKNDVFSDADFLKKCLQNTVKPEC